MVMAVLGEIPAVILSLYIVDAEGFGRKRTMQIFYILLTFTNILCFFDIWLGFFLLVTRFALREVSSMLYAYTTEVYSTDYRSIGIGWASGMGRLGTCIMPFIIFPLFQYGDFIPFLMFGFLGGVCTICSFLLPYDTMGK